MTAPRVNEIGELLKKLVVILTIDKRALSNDVRKHGQTEKSLSKKNKRTLKTNLPTNQADYQQYKER